MKALFGDLGLGMGITLKTDASAAKGIATRKGLGKVRHVELRYLWVQDVVKEKRLAMRRGDGEKNLADHLTKPKSKLDMEVKMGEAAGVMITRDAKNVAFHVDQT